MSTTLIDGGRCGPDEAGGQYRNRVLTDRAVWWEANGARQGVRRGFDLSVVPGNMELGASPGLGLVEERDATGITGVTHRGYAVWTDTPQTLVFDPASASDRVDAVVLAFVDVSVGAAAVGTETTVVGGQIVVVPGVSGVTTPRTDGDINTAVGSGGWVRLADVLVESTDTEINPANLTTIPPTASTRPVGEITMWYGAEGDVPNGWLVCDGSTFSAATYPVLQALLGSTTLPDFTDRMPIGAGTKALGTSGGASSHSHSISTDGGVYSLGSPGLLYGTDGFPRNIASHNHGGSSGSANSLPPWRALWFIIRAL